MTRRFRTILFALSLAIPAPSIAHPTVAAHTAFALFALDASRHKEPLPSDLPAAVAAQLTPGEGVRVTVEGTTLDFWWVKALPVKGTAESPTWADVEEGALVGAVRVSADFRDMRGRVIKPGTYTLRYGIQPQNGDHLGVSPFREFLLISPAALDTDAAPRGHEATVEISKRTIGGSHPAVWSIDPPVAAAGQSVASSHKTDLGHDAVIVEVPTLREGKTGALKFGIVLVGRIEG